MATQAQIDEINRRRAKKAQDDLLQKVNTNRLDKNLEPMTGTTSVAGSVIPQNTTNITTNKYGFQQKISNDGTVENLGNIINPKPKPTAELGGFLEEPLKASDVGITKPETTEEPKSNEPIIKKIGDFTYISVDGGKSWTTSESSPTVPDPKKKYEDMTEMEKAMYKSDKGTTRLKEDIASIEEQIRLNKEQIKQDKIVQSEQNRANQGGVMASFGESRLGATTSSAPLAQQAGLKAVDRANETFGRQLQQNYNSIADKQRELIRAVENDDIAKKDLIMNEIAKIQAENLTIQDELAKAEAEDKKFQLDVQKQASDYVSNTLTAFGAEGLANMTDNNLINFVSSTAGTYGLDDTQTASLLGQTTAMRALAGSQLALKKDDPDYLTKLAQLEKLNLEIANFGKVDPTKEQQNFQFYGALLDKDTDLAEKFAQMTGISEKPKDKSYNFQTIGGSLYALDPTTGEVTVKVAGNAYGFTEVDGKLYATDPKTGKASIVPINKSGAVVAPDFSQVGNGKITYNYGSISKNASDNVYLQNGLTGTPGIDIDGMTGDPIQSFVSGTVLQVAQNGGYGNQVKVVDDNGNEHWYSHLREVPEFLTVGQKVGAGDIIGYMGNTGSVFGMNGTAPLAGDTETGSHLDYRIKGKTSVNGSYWIDPNKYISDNKSKSSEEENLDIILTQVKSGNYTPKEASEFREDFVNAGRGAEYEEAISSPRNKLITEGTALKFNVPASITTGKLDEIISSREKAGFGNRQYQSLDTKEYEKITDWINTKKDVVDMLALKSGYDYIKTLPQEDKQRLSDLYGEDILSEKYRGINTGGGVPVVQWFGEALGNADKYRTALITLSGRYTVDYMKAISGVAISEQEATRLQGLLPNYNQADSRFISAGNASLKDLDRNLTESAKKFGFNTIDELRKATARVKTGDIDYFTNKTLTDSYLDTVVPSSVQKTEQDKSVDDYLDSLPQPK